MAEQMNILDGLRDTGRAHILSMIGKIEAEMLPADADAVDTDPDALDDLAPMCVLPEPLAAEALCNDTASAQGLRVVLGGRIWAEMPALLKGRIWHWSSGSRLLAVLDMKSGLAGLRDGGSATGHGATRFVARPLSAAGIPQGFCSATVDDMLWSFGLHGPTSPLQIPYALFSEPVELVGHPHVAPGLLQPRHHALMDLLARGPHRFADVRAWFGEPPVQLLHDYAALFFTRSLRVLEPCGRM